MDKIPTHLQPASPYAPALLATSILRKDSSTSPEKSNHDSRANKSHNL